MENKRILNIIINLATKATGVDINEYTLIDRFPFDDFDRVNFEMAVENFFNIDFINVDDKFAEVETIYDLALLVESLIKEKEKLNG